MADNLYKIVVEVQQREQLKELKADFEQAHTELRLLNADFKAGVITQAQFAAQSQATAAQMLKLNTQIKAVQSSLRGGILGNSGLGGGGMSGLLQAGYLIDDIQYGFSSIVNNIPQLVMGLGGSAGLAGALGIAAVAASQLMNHWDQFFGSAEDGSKKLVASIDMIKLKTEELQGNLTKILTGRPFEQKESGSFIQEYLESGIGGDVVGKIAEKLGGSGEGAQLTAAQEEEAAGYKRVIESGKKFGVGTARVQQDKLNNLYKTLQQKNVEKAGEMVAKASTGDKTALAWVMKFAPPEIAEGLRGLTPEALKAQDFELQDEIDKGKDLHEAGEKRRKAQKQQDKNFEKFKRSELKDEERAKQKEKWAKTDFRERQIDELEERKKKVREEANTKSQVYGGTAEFSKSFLTKSLDKIPKESLDKLKSIDKNIDILRKEIKDINRLR